jgi:hypothetical protein
MGEVYSLQIMFDVLEVDASRDTLEEDSAAHFHL